MGNQWEEVLCENQGWEPVSLAVPLFTALWKSMRCHLVWKRVSAELFQKQPWGRRTILTVKQQN